MLPAECARYLLKNKANNKMTTKNFNLVITGVGGQGLITLLQIIAQAAFIEGYDIKTSELHGLSQRGGSVAAYLKFGKKVYSPLISLGQAEVVLGLEILEGLRALPYANKNTIFVINKFYFPFEGGLPQSETIRKINALIKGPKYLIPASEICQKELGREVVSGIYLLGCAVFKKIIPLRPDSVLKAIEQVMPEKYLELNRAAFNLAKSYKYGD